MIEGATAATAAAADIFITPDAVVAAAVIVDFGSSVCERANASEIDLETRPKAASLPDEQTRRIKEYHTSTRRRWSRKKCDCAEPSCLICTFDCDLKRNELGAKSYLWFLAFLLQNGVR